MIPLLLTQLFYRPILNLFFLLHGLMPYGVSLGWSIIVLSVIIRTLLIPLLGDLLATDSERHLVEAAVQKVESEYGDDPAMKKKMLRKLMRESSFAIVAWVISMAVQLIILLVLWRFFGFDTSKVDHLLYDFVTLDTLPIVQWFKYSLVTPSNSLAIIMALLLFLELSLGQAASRLLSASSKNKTLQYGLPIMSYLALARLPAALTLYLITTLVFSLVLLMFREFSRRIGAIADLVSESEEIEEQE